MSVVTGEPEDISVYLTVAEVVHFPSAAGAPPPVHPSGAGAPGCPAAAEAPDRRPSATCGSALRRRNYSSASFRIPGFK